MANESKSKAAPVTVVLLVAMAGAGMWWFMGTDQEPPAEAPIERRVDPKDKPNFASDEERRAYVDAHMSVSDVDIGADEKPDGEGEVPGLLRVTGQVSNTGDRNIKDVRLVLFMLDDSDEVVGTFLENILDKRDLPPGDKKPFKFTIPDKKEYSGRFRHKLR